MDEWMVSKKIDDEMMLYSALAVLHRGLMAGTLKDCKCVYHQE